MGTKKLDNTEKHIGIGLKPSTKLQDGHYEILANLGEPGGFGITYLGQDTKLNSKVAIKEYFPRTYANRDKNKTVIPTDTKEDKADFKWGYDAFKKEAQTIANLEKHPNIIDVKNLFEENGTIYFVMSYAEGIDLEAYLKKNHPLSQAEIEEIMFPFLEGVKHIHEANLLHRDIKLANILITKNRQPILIDFGTARNELSQKSKKMTAVYTEGYAALEQQTQSKEGAYTDIYAIGMLMYSLVNGITETKLLPSAIKRFEALHNKEESLLTFPKDKRFTKEFIEAIKKALEIKKEDRPQNVQTLIDLLHEEPRTKKRTYAIILIATASLLALLTVGNYYLNKQKENPPLSNEKTTFLQVTETTKKIIEEKTDIKEKEIKIEKEIEKEKTEEIKEKVIKVPINYIKLAETAIMRGDIQTALQHLSKDPSSQTPKGALRIAEQYHALKGEENNAIKWYEKAEKLGYTKAQYPLAVLYCKQGNFKKFTTSKGIFSYAKNSRKEFKYDIALCYNDLGNIAEARKWFEASASMGYVPAKQNLYTLLTGELGYSSQKAQLLIDKLQK